MFSFKTFAVLAAAALSSVVAAPAEAVNITFASPEAAQASVFYCVDAGFTGACHLSPPISGNACHNLDGSLAPFNDQISSFGPDAGLICAVFIDINCGGASFGPIVEPGISDFSLVAGGEFNDEISSYRC